MSTTRRGFDKPSDSKFRIKVSKDGPYIVYGNVPLTINMMVSDDQGVPYEWRAEKRFPAQETYSLCRCGKSKNKPFCDGTHLKIKFDGAETASRVPYIQQAKVVKGPGLTLTDLPDLCVSARFCDRAGGIWKRTEQSDTPEARQIAIEEAANCPSGRLVVWDKDGKPIEPHFEPSIELTEDPYMGASGPLWVRGGIPIESADGTLYEVRNRVTLCRCGRSKNKPFCDGLHLEK